LRTKPHFLSILFFLSGFTGLIYEIVWSRILSTILGNTSLAISVVVSIFLGGLALGSFLAPRIGLLKKNPLKVYGAIEIFVAVYSATTPWLSSIIDRIYALQYAAVADRFWLSIIVKALITCALFLLPSIAMGATLPVLTRIFDEQERSHRAAKLYGLNTLGAVIGTLLCGYLVLPLFGIKHTIFYTAFLNVTIGVIALASAKGETTAFEETTEKAGFHPIYFLFFLTGFSILAYEILWTRALSMFFGSSVYAFSSILAAFLLGIALGSTYYAKRIPEKADPFQFFSLIQFRISLAAVFFIGVFMGIPFILIRLFGWLHDSFGLYQTAQFFLIGATVFYATFLSGAAFPAALHFFRINQERLSSMSATFTPSTRWEVFWVRFAPDSS
jgi:spermidine synthase